MREIRQSGSEGGARFNPSFLPLSLFGSCLHRESIGMDSQALRRKNDGVLECARQSAASTPLWSCPERQISLERRVANPLTPNQAHNQFNCKQSGT